MALAGSWSDVGGAHIQAFTFSFQDHGRLSIVHVSKHSLFSWRRHSQDHGRLSGVWCGVLWWCVCVVCGEAWLSLSLVLSPSSSLSLTFSLFFLFFFFSCSFSYSCSCSCSFSFSSFFFLPFYSLFSSLHGNKHCTKHWSTNTASNFEAFECDVAHGTSFIATANELHGMFPPLLLPSSSLLPPPSLPHPEKREGTFFYRNISGEEFNFYYSFKLIPKNRRLVKLQSLQFFFFLNSKTLGL